MFNDTDAEVLWLIIDALEEWEFLQFSKSKIDMSLIYPVDPKQLPNELARVEWPPKVLSRVDCVSTARWDEYRPTQ